MMTERCKRRRSNTEQQKTQHHKHSFHIRNLFSTGRVFDFTLFNYRKVSRKKKAVFP